MNGDFRTIAAALSAVCLSVTATGVAAFTGPIPAAPDPFCSMAASSPPWNIEAAEPMLRQAIQAELGIKQLAMTG